MASKPYVVRHAEIPSFEKFSILLFVAVKFDSTVVLARSHVVAQGLFLVVRDYFFLIIC